MGSEDLVVAEVILVVVLALISQILLTTKAVEEDHIIMDQTRIMLQEFGTIMEK